MNLSLRVLGSTTRLTSVLFPAASRPKQGLNSPQLRAFATASKNPIRDSKSAANPLGIVATELAQVRSSLPNLVASRDARLSEVAQYYFKQPSKLVCPTISFLLAKATDGLGRSWPGRCLSGSSSDKQSGARTSSPQETGVILPTQVRLAEILELIHTASLIHDDVIDTSPMRRGVPSAPAVFGDKVAILGGTWVLGQAWRMLDELQSPKATQIIMGVLEDLIEGELMQLRDQTPGLAPPDGPVDKQATWDRYLKKSYLKTASLVARGAQATVVLGGCEDDESWQNAAFCYGRDLGIAFQLVDDALDYESHSSTLGKPGGADLHLGLVTAPALFAMEEHPDMEPLIQRSFAEEGDIEKAMHLVRDSSAISKTRQLANKYAEAAKEALKPIPESAAKEALEKIVDKVVHRKS